MDVVVYKYSHREKANLDSNICFHFNISDHCSLTAFNMAQENLIDNGSRIDQIA